MTEPNDVPNHDLPAQVYASQLAKLQDALIAGRIDNKSYESLKADLMAVTSDAPSMQRPDAPGSPSTKASTDDNQRVPEDSGTPRAGDVLVSAQAPVEQTDGVPSFVLPLMPDTVDELFALLKHPWPEPNLLPVPWATAFVSELRTIVANYLPRMDSYSGYHVDPDIPTSKLNGARAAMCIPSQERVVALYDDTVFGSAKDGIAFGERAIYWKLGWQAVMDEKGPFRLDYCQIQRLPIYWNPSPESAYVGNPFKRLSFGTKQNERAIYDMLIEIQKAALNVTGAIGPD